MRKEGVEGIKERGNDIIISQNIKENNKLKCKNM